MGAITKNKQPDYRAFRKAHPRVKASNEPKEQIVEKKCGECAKMRKRSDFSKDEWKKEDGNIRSCWSCKGDDQAQTKDCNKCSHSKVKSFFTKQEWANATIHVCNECKKEKSVVKKVKAPEGVKTKTGTEVITKVMKGVKMKSPKETDLKAPNEIETKAFKEVKKTTSKELKTKAPKEVEAEVPILKKKKLTK